MNKKINLAFFLALICLSQALSPEDFSQRLDNFQRLQAESLTSQGKQVPPGITILITEANRLYSEAFDAYGKGDGALLNEKAELLGAKLDEIEANSPGYSMQGLKSLALSELGLVKPESILEIRPQVVANVPNPTVIYATIAPTEKGRLIPTISPGQLRGRQNFVYALGDILWENKLLLGVFIAGILILYAVYSKQDEESDLEYSGD
ncbi:MAG: hypothetical protein AABX01_00410 [Candidatus Micrarchaeota archaeon]